MNNTGKERRARFAPCPQRQGRETQERQKRQERQAGLRPGPRKGSRGNNSPRAPLVLSASYQRSGAPGRFRAARPTAASSRNSLPALSAAGVVQAPRPYSVSWNRREFAALGRGKCQGSGGNNSPRAPLVLSASYQRSGKRGARSAEREGQREVAPRPEVSADALRAANSVQACALRPPAVADRCFRFRGNIGVDGRDFQIFRGEGTSEALESHRWAMTAASRRSGGPSLVAYPRLSTLGRAFVDGS